MPRAVPRQGALSGRGGRGSQGLAALGLCALSTVGREGTALADDVVLDVPAPPSLPALGHVEPELGYELTSAVIRPNQTITTAEALFWSTQAKLEVPFDARHWYVGVSAEQAATQVQGLGGRVFVGSPEVWVRGLWTSVHGVSSGGGLGITVPVTQELDARERELLRTVRTVRPWDAPHFLDLAVTFRPFFDIRHISGPFLFQLRQGLDWVVDVERGVARADLTARATFYVGYHKPGSAAAAGIELWESYELLATDRDGNPLPDDKRASFSISPSVRFLPSRSVQPALSVLLPISTPLRGEVDSYVALRFHVAFELARPSSPRPPSPLRGPAASTPSRDLDASPR